MGFRVARRHVNGRDGCHGGMLAGFADVAWGQALAGRYGGWATIRLTTDFLSNTSIGSWVEGASVLLSEEDDIYILRGRIWCEDRTLVTGIAIYKGLERRT